MLDLIALFSLTLLLGGMVFFAAVMAPLVFMRLPAQQAGLFIRAVFPVYYLYVFITSAVAALTVTQPRAAAALAIIATITVWLRQWLMPRINRWSDAARTGDSAAQSRFNRAHRLSVAVNLAQMVTAGVVLTRFAAH